MPFSGSLRILLRQLYVYSFILLLIFLFCLSPYGTTLDHYAKICVSKGDMKNEEAVLTPL